MLNRRAFFGTLTAILAWWTVRPAPIKRVIPDRSSEWSYTTGTWRPHPKQREFFESREHGFSMRYQAGKWYKGPTHG